MKLFNLSLMTIGIDEAGRGPLAGPVVAAAVKFKSFENMDLINDSKKLTAKKREQLFSIISEQAIIGLGIVEAAEIDQINIYNATKKAFYLAANKLLEQVKHADYQIIIDGNFVPNELKYAQSIIKGDGTYYEIAAASIVAKVTRDRIMQTLSEVYPHYGWSNNMGYGTKAHIEAINIYGITPHHRKSFEPVKSMLIITQQVLELT
ncbi:ribonuclease HII [Rickettsiales endosymbiont of Stachyamoeba lipophora]|uniref:ribonuclease HII n=1 Tax=Rickettsiales endosymbiont of Stachyamoeba lipophora TaxID=2486578 RepID=UPI000F656126|nr:ribonuclease HII [Rickettsiales endosymbiont of Stachyamoeba lipophora]AZL16132.1 ribonuclease HII [Rickettsiales endosymbiont of Stachyamoeba lipophora]